MLRRFGRIDDFLTGVACVDAYLGAILVASPYVFGHSGMPDDVRGWVILVALSTFFGLLVEYFWFGDRTASSEV